MNAGQICSVPITFSKKGTPRKICKRIANIFTHYYPEGNENDYTSMVNNTLRENELNIEDANLREPNC